MMRVFQVFVAMLLLAVSAAAQPPPPPPDPAQTPAPGVLAPREIQQMFDAYVLMQAQDVLGLTEEQFPQFVTRLKALQEIRRRQQVGRNRILQELNRLTTRNTNSDEGAIREQLKALQEHDARTVDEVTKAYDALDRVLTPRQQARLRVFEEQMERRKVDLLLRARQAARGAQTRPKRP